MAENILPGSLCIIWKLNEAWPQKKDSVTFLRLLKFLKLRKNSITVLRLLKFLILKNGLRLIFMTLKVINAQKGLHHFLMTLKVFNNEKGLHDFLTTLHVFNIEKGFHHFLETLKGFNFEKWLHHILMTLEVSQNSYSVECWWTAASDVRLSYHVYINKLDLRWLPNFIALGMCFLYGTKLSWNEGTDTCCNVECVLLGRNVDFLGGYLVDTACYIVLTIGC